MTVRRARGDDAGVKSAGLAHAGRGGGGCSSAPRPRRSCARARSDEVNADINEISPASTTAPTISASRSAARPGRASSGTDAEERERFALGREPGAAADRAQRAVREVDREEDAVVTPGLDGGDAHRALDHVREILPGGDEERRQHVRHLRVPAHGAGHDRPHQVLAEIDLDQRARRRLERALERLAAQLDLGVDALAAAFLEVDRRRLLVDADVAGEGDADDAGRRRDQLVHRAIARDRHHVHAHGVAGLEAEAQEDRGAHRARLDFEQTQEAAGALGHAADVLVVSGDPGQERVGLLDAGGAEHRRARHADVLDVDDRAAGAADRGAAAVDAREQRALGGGERHRHLVVDVLAAHAHRPHDSHRDLRRADQVLAVTGGGALGVHREPRDVLERDSGRLLEREAADLGRLGRRELARELMEAEVAGGELAHQVRLALGRAVRGARIVSAGGRGTHHARRRLDRAHRAALRRSTVLRIALTFPAPAQNIAMRSSWITRRSLASTASADSVAAARNGYAMPTRSAPSARHLAASMPLRTPPLAMIESPGIEASSWMQSGVGIPQSAKLSPRSRSPDRDASIRAQLVPPTPATSMVRMPMPRQLLGGARRDAAADLLRDHRHLELAHHLRHLGQQVREVAVALGLERLLERIQVQHQRVGADHLHGAPTVLDAIAVVELHRAEVGEQRHRRRGVPHQKGLRQRGALERLALRADADRDPDPLGGEREILVDARCGPGAAGHAGDEQRRGEPLAEELDGGVDRREVELGQRAMLEVPVVEEARLELHALLEREPKVLRLAIALERRDRLALSGPRHHHRLARRALPACGHRSSSF